MTITRRSYMWSLIIIAIGSVWLLMVAGAFPNAIEDILFRAWPALAVLFGFDVLLGRRRVRIARWALDTSYVGMVLTVVLVVGVVFFAYRKQADVVRSDNVQEFSKVLPDAIERVELAIDVQRTAVTVTPAGEYERELAVTFSGSNESDVEIVWELLSETATLTINESYHSSIPSLEDYGRGTLLITLPIGVSVDLFDLSVVSGDVSFDLTPVTLPALVLTVDEGDVAIKLPTTDVLAGDLRVDNGDVDVMVPMANTLNIKAQGNSSPTFQFDRDRYDLLVGGELKNKSVASFDYSLDVWMSGGSLLTITDVP